MQTAMQHTVANDALSYFQDGPKAEPDPETETTGTACQEPKLELEPSEPLSEPEPGSVHLYCTLRLKYLYKVLRRFLARAFRRGKDS